MNDNLDNPGHLNLYSSDLSSGMNNIYLLIGCITVWLTRPPLSPHLTSCFAALSAPFGVLLGVDAAEGFEAAGVDPPPEGSPSAAASSPSLAGAAVVAAA